MAGIVPPSWTGWSRQLGEMKMKLVFQGRLRDALAQLESIDTNRSAHPIGMIFSDPPARAEEHSNCEVWMFLPTEDIPSERNGLVHFIDVETALEVAAQGDALASARNAERLTASQRFLGIRHYAENDAYLDESKLFEES